MDKKRKRIPLLASVTALYLITCVVIAILDYCVKGEKQYIVYLKIGSLIIVVVYFIISMVQLLKALWPVFIKWWKNWNAIIWTIVITLTIPVVIHFLFYSGAKIDQNTMMSAYTGYLSFVGAFSLGYFLYKREELKNYETLKKKARLIYESMQYIQINFDNIDSFIDGGETYPIAENWRSDYLDIKHLVKYDEFALGYELQYFFGRVEAINKAIVAVDKVRAKRLYLDFLQKEKNSASGYNYMDAGSVMLLISLDMPQHNTWKEIEKDRIEEYAEKFFTITDLWIYNYLIKKQLTSCDMDIIKLELVEWLLKNPELSAWVKHSYEKRKITEVIFGIALKMNEKSPNLNYCWREFSLKQPSQQ